MKEREEMSLAKTTTRKVAAWIAQVSFEKIPSDVIKPIKDSVIDTIGCGILGSTSPFAKLIRDYIVGWKSAGSIPNLCHGLRSRCPNDETRPG